MKRAVIAMSPWRGHPVLSKRARADVAHAAPRLPRQTVTEAQWECVFNVLNLWRGVIARSKDFDDIEPNIVRTRRSLLQIAHRGATQFPLLGGCDAGSGSAKIHGAPRFNFDEDQRGTALHDEIDLILADPDSTPDEPKALSPQQVLGNRFAPASGGKMLGLGVTARGPSRKDPFEPLFNHDAGNP